MKIYCSVTINGITKKYLYGSQKQLNQHMINLCSNPTVVSVLACDKQGRVYCDYKTLDVDSSELAECALEHFGYQPVYHWYQLVNLQAQMVAHATSEILRKVSREGNLDAVISLLLEEVVVSSLLEEG